MFTSRFYHNLDEKGRLTIPAEYRDSFADSRAVITQGFEKNLIVLQPENFDRVAQRLRGMSMTNPEVRLLRRIVFSGASHIEIDKAGRILIPNYLRKYANLETSVVIAGAGDYFEIWSEADWQSQDEEVQNAQENAQRFSGYELTWA
jgi:MraZ protein